MFSRLASTAVRTQVRSAAALTSAAPTTSTRLATRCISAFSPPSNGDDDPPSPLSSTAAATIPTAAGVGATSDSTPLGPATNVSKRSHSTAATTGLIDGRALFNPAMFTMPVLPSATMDVMPMSGTVGAEVRGVDLSRPLCRGDKERILEAYFRYGAIFFRDQDLTHDQHLALAMEFGEPEPHPIVAGIDGYPDIVRIIREAHTPTKFGETWHSDNSFMDEPSVGSLLVARELPPFGNDTLWASMYAVYDSLSDGLKEMLCGLTAVHSAAFAFNPTGGNRQDNYDGKKAMKYQLHPILERDVEHPAVITHPVTGKKSLFVNSMFTVRFKGMSFAESRPLLEYLYSVVERPEFQCRFRWAQGSVAFWDNRATQHMAIGDETRFRRVMERITLKGCQPSL